MQPRAHRLEVGWAVVLGRRNSGKPEDHPPTEGMCSNFLGRVIGGNFHNEGFCSTTNIICWISIFPVPRALHPVKLDEIRLQPVGITNRPCSQTAVWEAVG